jgi:hypothetical protein
VNVPRSAVFLLLAALVALPARAGEAVTIKANAGLGGLCRPGRWIPVRVDVDYRGAEAAGELIVDWGDARVRRAISLASQSRKQFELYVRTPDPRDSMTVRLMVSGHEVATAEAPVRLIAPADALTVCVAPANGWSASGIACSTTVSPEALPRSWRGYGAADDLVWQSGGPTMLSGEQQTALKQWRAVQAIENAEASSPSIAAITPTARALYRTGAAMLAYTIALGIFVWPLSRIRSRSLFAYPVIAALVAVGSVAAIASGRIGPGRSVHVSQAAVVQQLAGTKGSLVQAHGVAEFPSLGAVEVRAIRADGEMAVRSGRDRRDLSFDENGAPLFAGTYGLGATATFEVEAVTAFEALRAASRGTTVRVSNISIHQLRDCRFGTGFSRLNVGSLAPGQSVEAERRAEPGDAVFSCTLAAPVIELTESRRSIDSDGTAVVMIRLPEGPRTP